MGANGMVEWVFPTPLACLTAYDVELPGLVTLLQHVIINHVCVLM
jgi:hypothetical protein